MLLVRTLRLSVLTTALAAVACAADGTGPPASALAPTALGIAADGGVITTDPPAPADSDGDGVFDDSDNCLFTPNPDQADADGDGFGDACAGDVGGDPPEVDVVKKQRQKAHDQGQHQHRPQR